MKIFKTSNFSILFGGSESSPFIGSEFHTLIGNNKNILQNKINAKTECIKQVFPGKDFIFLKQVHGSFGKIVTSKIKTLSCEGDYLITNKKNLGIGVLTADCLPIVFYDPIQNIIAIAHAGWQGSLAGISQKVVKELLNKFNSKIKDIEIFFGPSANVCCYEVQPNFLEKIEHSIKEQTTIIKNNKIFFNLPYYNFLKLQELSIDKKKIDLNYNFCTICNIEYCSYRRDKEKAGRQMTIITLNSEQFGLL